MLTKLDRYLMKEVLLTFFATTLVLLAILLSNRLAGYLNQVASGLLAGDVIFLLLGFQAVYFLVVLVPVALLLSIMLALGRLYRDNEMTALAACGIGPGAIYRPLLLLTVPMIGFLAVLSLYIVPLAMELQLELQVQARQDAEITVINPGTFREVADGQHVVYVGALADNRRELYKVFIRSLGREGIAVTTGERGYQEIDPATGARYIVLNEGYRYEGIPGQGDYQNVRFERLTVRLDFAPVEQEWPNRKATLTSDLWHSSDAAHVAELHRRLSGPVSLVLIVFLAPLLARAPPREGRYARVVGAILIYTIYFNLLRLGETWLEHGFIWPVLGLWWVHGVFALLALGIWVYQYGVDIRFLKRPASGKPRP